MTAARGAIYAEARYLMAKMLDHSCWQEGEQPCWEKSAPRLPRLITPSDLDTVFCRLLNDPMSVPAIFDNNRRMIFAELSSSNDDWRLIRQGQFRLYEGLLSGGSHCAVLCRHVVSPDDGRKICTRHDIVSFQPMVWDYGPVIGGTIHSNSLWQEFVFKWFDDPIKLRRRIIGFDAGLKPLAAVK